MHLFTGIPYAPSPQSNDRLLLLPQKGAFACLLSCMWVCVKLAAALTGGRCAKRDAITASGPLQRPAEESTTSRPPSPDSRITTWRSDSGCCPSWPPCQTLLPYPMTPSPISSLKVPKPPPLSVWFLFIHVVRLPPPPSSPHRSWITFKIYCISKTQSRLPVYRSCQEAVMLVCSTRHTHTHTHTVLWIHELGVKNLCKCLRVCLCVCVHMFAFDFPFAFSLHGFDDMLRKYNKARS